jgi:hypothetical protein
VACKYRFQTSIIRTLNIEVSSEYLVRTIRKRRYHAFENRRFYCYFTSLYQLLSLCRVFFLINLTHAWLYALPRPMHRRPRIAREFCRWLSMRITSGIKGSSYLCSKRRCWKCYPSTRRHSSHRRKRFWFTFWRCSAGIFEISLRIGFSDFVHRPDFS